MGAVESRPSGGGSPADGALADEPYDAWRGSSTSANRRVSARARFRASGTRFEDEATSSDTETRDVLETEDAFANRGSTRFTEKAAAARLASPFRALSVSLLSFLRAAKVLHQPFAPFAPFETLETLLSSAEAARRAPPRRGRLRAGRPRRRGRAFRRDVPRQADVPARARAGVPVRARERCRRELAFGRGFASSGGRARVRSPRDARSLREASESLDETHNASTPGSVLTVVITPTPLDANDDANDVRPEIDPKSSSGSSGSFPSRLFGGETRVRAFECRWEWPRSAEILPMETILCVCGAMHEWLAGDDARVVCLHARGGFRSGTASLLRFVTACYLCYAGEHEFAADALDAVSSAPPGWVAGRLRRDENSNDGGDSRIDGGFVPPSARSAIRRGFSYLASPTKPRRFDASSRSPARAGHRRATTVRAVAGGGDGRVRDARLERRDESRERRPTASARALAEECGGASASRDALFGSRVANKKKRTARRDGRVPAVRARALPRRAGGGELRRGRVAAAAVRERRSRQSRPDRVAPAGVARRPRVPNASISESGTPKRRFRRTSKRRRSNISNPA